jgi:ABC-type transport system substrate-binding protein
MVQGSYWYRYLNQRIERRRLLGGAASVGLGGVIIACGGGDSSDANSKSSGAGGQDDAKYGGTLRVGISGEPRPFEPHTGTGGGDHQFFYLTCDSLIGYDQKGQPDASISLTERWEVPEPTRVVLKLRSGITFSDGEPFTAEDVKWNIERIIDPAFGATPRTDLASIAGVDVVNKQEAVIRLKEPSAPLLTNLGDRGGQIVSRVSWDKMGKDAFQRNPIGTGPFKLREWVSDAFLIFERNTEYWRKAPGGGQFPYLQTIRFNILPDDTVRSASLETDEIDLLVGTPSADIRRLDADPRFRTVKFEGSRTALWYMNHHFAPLDNIWIRRALAHSMDKEAFIKNIEDGEGLRPNGLLTPASWGHDPSIEYYPYSLQKAREFLQRSGLPESQWSIKTQVQSANMTVGEQFWSNNIQESGIKLDWSNPERLGVTLHVLKGLGADGTRAMGFSGWSMRVDPYGNVGQFHTEKGAYNSSTMAMPDIEPLVIKARTTYDLNERKKLYSEIQKKAVDAVYSAVFTHYGVARSHASTKVGNLEALYGGEGKPRYANMWI